jgi:hypothetical protein
MGAILKRIDDPRDALDRSRRPDLVKFARANGMADISEELPAMVIRKRLRERGFTRIPLAPQRPLGSPPDAPVYAPRQAMIEEAGEAIDAVADLERQLAPKPKPKKPMSAINALRAECHKLGIKLDRRDNVILMRAKISAHEGGAGGEQDAARRDQ